jgi:hypothetical protein
MRLRPHSEVHSDFQTRGNKIRKFSTTIVAMTMLATPAAAAQCDPNALILDGIFSHGSVVCNQAWLDRPAALSVLRQAQNCHACDPKVGFVVIGNGRSFVSFSSGKLSLAFAGGHDRQPNLNNYYLSVDTIRMMKGGKQVAVDREMEGECHMTLSDDRDAFYLVHCDAYNRRTNEGHFFHLDNVTNTSHTTVK